MSNFSADSTHAPDSADPIRAIDAPQGRRAGDGGRFIESVIGADERTRVPDTTASPWRRICCLTITGSNGAVARGTGWLVGPRTLLTAGHCVFSTVLFDGWANSIVIEPARDGDELPYSRYLSQWFCTLDDWVRTEGPDADVGCIQLEEPLGDSLGWFRLDSRFADASEHDLLTIAGYPVDLSNGSALYTNRSRLVRATESQLYYQVDTAGGQSGAPIFVSERDGDAVAVGIHAYGSNGQADPVIGTELNSGRRFSPDLLVTVAGWINDNR